MSGTTRRVSFNSQLKGSEDLFKTMRKVITHLAENIEGQTYENLWDLVSTKPEEYYRRHFRRENKRNNPLSEIKRPRTAYTFFTQERRNAIKESNPNKSFGEISKMVAAEWRKLSKKARATYVKREEADKQRYETAKAELTAATATAEEQPEQVEEPASPPPEPAPKRTAKGKGRGRARK